MSLTCVCAYFNAGNFKSHLTRYRRFAAHMQESVRLITVECIFPGQTYAVTEANNPDHVQVFSQTPLWLKENLLNLGFARCTTPYVMWCDTDLHFEDSLWAEWTVDALKRYPIVQPYSLLLHNGANGLPFCQCRTVAAKRDEPAYYPDVPIAGDCNGGAWAFRQDVFHAMGGLFDEHILGDGDDVLAFSLQNRIDDAIRPGMHPVVQAHLRAYAAKIHFPCTALGGTISHQWHGPIRARGYADRWKILVEEGFNPEIDLVRNTYGVWECTKEAIIHRIHQYFLSRQEDQSA